PYNQASSDLFDGDFKDSIVKASLQGLFLDGTGQENLLGVLALLACSIQAENVTFQLNREPLFAHARHLRDEADVALLVEHVNNRFPDFLNHRALGRFFDVAKSLDDRLASLQRADGNAKDAIEIFTAGALRREGSLLLEFPALFREFAGQLYKIAQTLKEPAEGQLAQAQIQLDGFL